MKVLSWGITDVGLKRKQNQDTILLNPDLGLYIVADGMGGHKGGEVASAMACEIIQQNFEKQLNGGSEARNYDPRLLIIDSYADACQKIYERSTKKELDLKGMGTTVVMIFVQGDHIFIGNVGDSRAYLYRGTHLWPLTEDHSLTHEQLKEGAGMSEHVGKNVITRSVGFESEVIVDIFERKVSSGDKFLICSDGLCGLVPDEKISHLLKKNASPRVPEQCVRLAHKYGGDDNISAIVLEVVE